MDLFREWLGENRYTPAKATVPTEQHVQDPNGRFGFEMPWPWFIADPVKKSPRMRMDTILVAAPRTIEPWPTGTFCSVVERFSIDDASVKAESRSIASARGGRVVPPRRYLVGGAQTVDFIVDAGHTILHHVVIAEGELTVTADFTLPTTAAAGYATHLETMLATWYWT